MRITINFLIVIFISAAALNAENEEKKKLQKIQGEPSNQKFNINQISTFIKNDGETDYSPSGNSGLVFPKGSGKTAMFASGFMWGAKVNGEIRVNGSAYRTGLTPGKILNSGVPAYELIAEDPGSTVVRAYRVRPDINPYSPGTGDLSAEAADGEGTQTEIRAGYEKDWMEWPAADGAPFKDINENGIYDPQIDIPGYPGADQTIWFIANDLDPEQSDYFAGSEPMGIEIQVTAWGYNRNNNLGNTIFKRYKVINKSDMPFEDMYISQWNDPDVGDASDDFIGCDTILNLMYAYNSENFDLAYADMPPPAIGFSLLQGPVTDSPGDTAVSGGRKIIDKKNLPVTSHFYFICGLGDYCQPYPGIYALGTLQWYNWFQGKSGNGLPFQVPEEAGGGTTSFMLSGDPVSQTGWVDGLISPAGDRRAGFASGPFNMAPGDTQEIIIAEAAAAGQDNIDAIKVLRYYSSLNIINFKNNFDLPPRIPDPQSAVTSDNLSIKIEWTADQAIENFSSNGYEFQGYNIYQFEFETGTPETAVKIASFDKADGITQIPGLVMDPETGYPLQGTIKIGTDTGLKYSFILTKDSLENKYLMPGKTYYFAVTAYGCNPQQDPAFNFIESRIKIDNTKFDNNIPGPLFGESLEVTHSSGMGDAIINVTVTDPYQTTGNEYEIFFRKADYFRDENGDWIEIESVHGKPKNTGDLSLSYLEAAAIYGEEGGTIELNFTLYLDSPDDAWADGILLTFPETVNILKAEGYSTTDPVIDHTSNTVLFGNNNLTQAGEYYSGSEVKVVTQLFTPPTDIIYTIYDDGYNPEHIENAEGVLSINSIEYKTKTEYYWNVKNLTIGDTLLWNQTVINNHDIYTGEYKDNPVVEGFEISVNALYNVPLGSYVSGNYTGINIYDYYGNGGNQAFERYGIGTTDPIILSHDYELRFTGEPGIIVRNQDTIHYVRSGGQMATIYALNSQVENLDDHPLNPNPGVAAPFLVRIPFEVWNTTLNKQINFMFNDRSQYSENRPFYVWNPYDWTIGILVNSDYNENQVIPIQPGPLNSAATWVLDFHQTDWNTGDKVSVTYYNPVIPGEDRFVFKTSARNDNIPDKITLYQNYPNPFNPFTTIRFYLTEQSSVKLEVFDVLGRRVSRLTEGDMPAGFHETVFNGSNLASGVYIYRLEGSSPAGTFIQTKKLLLIK